MHSVTKGNFFCFTFSFIILPLLLLLQSSLLVWLPSVVATNTSSSSSSSGILPSWLTRETTSRDQCEKSQSLFLLLQECGCRTTSIIMMAHIFSFPAIFAFRLSSSLQPNLLLHLSVRWPFLLKKKSFPSSSSIFIGCWSLPLFSSTSSNATLHWILKRRLLRASSSCSRFKYI